jgi:hypothetical protein
MRKVLLHLLDQRGWLPDSKQPDKAVASSLWYLKQKGRADNSLHGWWLVKTSSPTGEGNPPESESGGDAHQEITADGQ